MMLIHVTNMKLKSYVFYGFWFFVDRNDLGVVLPRGRDVIRLVHGRVALEVNSRRRHGGDAVIPVRYLDACKSVKNQLHVYNIKI